MRSFRVTTLGTGRCTHRPGRDTVGPRGAPASGLLRFRVGWLGHSLISPALIGCLAVAGLLLGRAACAKTTSVRGERLASVPASFFGLHLHRAVGPAGTVGATVWPLAQFGSWRLWDAGVAWRDLEPARGRWDFTRLDSCITLAQRHGVDVLLPLGLSPPWASARPTERSAYAPGNAAEPMKMADWSDYVSTVAKRYKGRIHSYEVWNEPNLKRFFSGDMKSVLALASEAYRVLKSVDSTCIVVSTSATGRDGAAWLDRYLAAGGGNWADVIGFHAYVGQNRSPEDMADLLHDVKKVLTDRKLSTKPLWDTETGWAIHNRRPLSDSLRASAPPSRDALPDSTAAAYVARALLLAWAEGVGRYYWYSWDNYSMGLVEPDGVSMKAAGRAYGVAGDWMIGATLVKFDLAHDGTYQMDLKRSDGDVCTILWRRSGSTWFSLPPSWRRWRESNLRGSTQGILSADPGGRVLVGESPVMVEPLP